MSGIITNIKLNNFRSYRFLDLPVYSKYVVLTGQNGAGKTNVLEAISLFSSTKGIRKANSESLTHKCASSILSWRADISVKNNFEETFLSTFYVNSKRSGSIDESPISSLGKFEDIIWLLWVTPQISEIFQEQNHIKRSFFDHLVTGMDGSHNFRLRYLGKLLKERMHILMNNYNDIWLTTIETKIAELYLKIHEKRMIFLNRLKEEFSISDSSLRIPHIFCSGEFELLAENTYEKDVVSEILNKMKFYRNYDSEKGTTFYGVHKTIWNVIDKENKLSATDCSSGEQKSMLISLILASVMIYRRYRKGLPVLLMDDVMVHLDNSQREILSEELIKMDVQAFLTGTDISFFERLKNRAQMIKISNSCVLS